MDAADGGTMPRMTIFANAASDTQYHVRSVPAARASLPQAMVSKLSTAPLAALYVSNKA